MSAANQDPTQLGINALRTLAMDAVEQAKSGHPGTPMALAPVAFVLWNEFLKFDPAHPTWPARDRFVLSCGHASMLLYGLLHLADVRQVGKDGTPSGTPAITLDDIRRFRQWGSPCAGHPEYGEAPGIETTTGPLGQGVANSVGMAIAAKWTAARYGQSAPDLFAYRTFVLCSDGDLMEGVATEAASLAGHLRLGNLCWIYDDNHITIEGDTELAFSEDVAQRFEALGWRTYSVDDANDLDALRRALEWFESADDRPALIRVRSIIGYGAPNKAGSHAAHGAPLGPDEVRGAKEFYGWPVDEPFFVPEEARQCFRDGIGKRGAAAYADWQAEWEAYREAHPASAGEVTCLWNRELPAEWSTEIPTFETDAKGMATRVSSGLVLNGAAKGVPWLLGGSADLAPSNMTALKGERDFEADAYDGRIFHFGIREHAMAAAANGMAQSGLRPFVATFFVFTDYLRPSMRLAAMMKLPVLYILSHDSIGLGEDGPTHQPVEHLAACRAIPGLSVVRPADAREVAAAYRSALATADGPVALVLTRQAVPTLAETEELAGDGVARGAYVLRDPVGGKPDVILMASGSEVPICMTAAAQLEQHGVAARVVSVPCMEWFERQSAEYRDSVLPPTIGARIAVEAAVRQSWDRYLGDRGTFIGMSGFGASAPYQELYERFGLTSEHVVRVAKELVEAGG